MKLLVLSDTHGRIERVLRLLPLLSGLDGIVHLGDNLRDGGQLARASGLPVHQVGGNCDGVTRRDDALKVLETPYGRLLLTHGHLHGAKSGPQRLVYQAREMDCAAVLYGHTHVPFCGEWEGVRLLNPGSISFPRHDSVPTYAILTLGPGSFSCAVVPYSEEAVDYLANANKAAGETTPDGENTPDKKPPGKKPPGGFLRNLINHSDRF
jgi:putative phosphoesterase